MSPDFWRFIVDYSDLYRILEVSKNDTKHQDSGPLTLDFLTAPIDQNPENDKYLYIGTKIGKCFYVECKQTPLKNSYNLT
jgi:hypothetical protein